MYLLIIVEILKNSDWSCQTAFVHLPIISRAYHIVVDKDAHTHKICVRMEDVWNPWRLCPLYKLRPVKIYHNAKYHHPPTTNQVHADPIVEAHHDDIHVWIWPWHEPTSHKSYHVLPINSPHILPKWHPHWLHL
jgi:hypothetical protein